MPSITLTDPVAHTLAIAGLIATNNGNLRTLLNSGIDAVNLKGAPSLVSGEVPVWNGSQFNRSSVTNIGPTSLGSGTPDATKFLRGDGSWQAVTAGSLLGVQVFTTGGTYTPTAGTTRVYIEAVGGGGAGGGGVATDASHSVSGGGGGGGAYAASFLTTGFSGKTVAIGAGGSGVNGGSGNPGGSTTFDTTVIVAVGGGGGAVGTQAINNTGAQGAYGGDAASCTGQIKGSGDAGGQGWGPGSAITGGGGTGGGCMFGGGAPGNQINGGGAVGGNAGHLYGGGGSGSSAFVSQAATTGGAGAAGIVRIWEYA